MIQLREDIIDLGSVEVHAAASLSQAQFEEKGSSDTLTDLVTAQSLTKPNAANASDYIKDAAGVTLSTGSNGASNISIRGIDQKMLQITVDGQRQGGMTNPLDNIPAAIVKSLDVTKTFTPDMDADAIGGVINVSTGGDVLQAGSFEGQALRIVVLPIRDS